MLTKIPSCIDIKAENKASEETKEQATQPEGPPNNTALPQYQNESRAKLLAYLREQWKESLQRLHVLNQADVMQQMSLAHFNTLLKEQFIGGYITKNFCLCGLPALSKYFVFSLFSERLSRLRFNAEAFSGEARGGCAADSGSKRERRE